MADELPEGHIQMSDKWAEMGAPGSEATTRRRSRATTTPVAEPEESTEAEEAEEDEDEGGDTEC